jgi:hypothetical protein
MGKVEVANLVTEIDWGVDVVGTVGAIEQAVDVLDEQRKFLSEDRARSTSCEIEARFTVTQYLPGVLPLCLLYLQVANLHCGHQLPQ